MHGKLRHTFLAAVIVSGLGLTNINIIYAAGYGIIEHSASGMGNSFAGSAAIAEDASTIYFNPAGMSQLKSSQLVLGGHLIVPDITFVNNNSITTANDPLTGAEKSDGHVTALIPNMYLSYALEKGVTAGIGINVPFGLATKYDDNWVGRYHAVESDLKTININPSISLKLTDKFSIGAGFSYQYVDVKLTSAIDFGSICNNSIPDSACNNFYDLSQQEDDGFAIIKGDGWSSGINFGALIQISDKNRLGLAYRSSISHTLKGTGDFIVPESAQFIVDRSGLFIDSNAQAKLTLPSSASLSMVHDMTPATSFLADVTWTEWSKFEELRVVFESDQPDTVNTAKWNNTYRIAFAINHKINSRWKLRTGAAYDESPISSDKRRTPRIPDADRIWLSLGVAYEATKNIHIDIGYAYLFADTVKTDNTIESTVPTVNHTIKGEYESSVNILSAQLRWSFD